MKKKKLAVKSPIFMIFSHFWKGKEEKEVLSQKRIREERRRKKGRVSHKHLSCVVYLRKMVIKLIVTATLRCKMDHVWPAGHMFDSTGVNQTEQITHYVEGANVQWAGRSTANSDLSPDASKLAASLIIDFVAMSIFHSS